MTSSRVSSSAMDVSVVADAASQFQLILETDAASSTCRISNVHLLSLQLPVTSVCELCWKCTKSDKTLQPSVPNIVCLWCECNLHRGQMAVFFGSPWTWIFCVVKSLRCLVGLPVTNFILCWV